MILKMLRVVTIGVAVVWLSVGIAAFAHPALKTDIARNVAWWLAVPGVLAIAVAISRSTERAGRGRT
jgi:hypothetical protein